MMSLQRKKEENGFSKMVHVKESPMKYYSWEEIEKHNSTHTNPFLVINNEVYDIKNWVKKHPGGKVILTYAGQDATDAFTALHPNLQTPEKYLQTLKIGQVNKKPLPPLLQEYRQLQKQLKKEGMFQANYLFYTLHLIQIIMLFFLPLLIFQKFGTNIYTLLIGSLLHCTSQAQAGWLQHDFGHSSVFKQTKWNAFFHLLTIGVFKGASSSWWNNRHFHHHSKPNVIKKDYDIKMQYLFILGKSASKQWGLAKRGVLPYDRQHWYWFLIFPPLLIPIYFHYEVTRHAIKYAPWPDKIAVFLYFIMFAFTYSFLGSSAFFMYLLARILESHWFVWVTQMNHLPMDIDFDQNLDWVTQQLITTCNVEQSVFNDWFCGHLNFQIEHHLFPTMPRHNYYRVCGRVKDLCERHGLRYTTKSLFGAFWDIVVALEEYGRIWKEAYHQDE